MKIKELREKNERELASLLESSRDLLRSLRFRVAANQEKDVREVRQTRKTVARIMTLLSEKKPIS